MGCWSPSVWLRSIVMGIADNAEGIKEILKRRD
jgi:hypothetical protein